MDNRAAAIGLGIGAVVLYLIAKKTAAKPQLAQTVGIASTTSPIGSSSGVLVPVSPTSAIQQIITGAEAFLLPFEQSSPTVTGAQISQAEQTGNSGYVMSDNFGLESFNQESQGF